MGRLAAWGMPPARAHARHEISSNLFGFFLDASLHPFKSVCPSVDRPVRGSVRDASVKKARKIIVMVEMMLVRVEVTTNKLSSKLHKIENLKGIEAIRNDERVSSVSSAQFNYCLSLH